MRSVLVGLAVALPMVWSGLAAGGDAADCESWKTAEFWETATARDVDRVQRACGDPNAAAMRTAKGWLPVHLAAAHARDIGAFTQMFASTPPADPNARTRDEEMTPLHLLVRYGHLQRGPTVLAMAGAEMDARITIRGFAYTYGIGALHLVTQREDGGDTAAAMAAAVLAAGGFATVYADDSRTPLHWAARYGVDSAVLDVLIAAKAKRDAEDNDDNMPLHLAAAYARDSNIVGRLAVLNDDIDAQNDQGVTSLQLACAGIAVPRPTPVVQDVVRHLIRAGADPCMVGKAGKSCHALARENPQLKDSAVFYDLIQKRCTAQ